MFIFIHKYVYVLICGEIETKMIVFNIIIIIIIDV